MHLAASAWHRTPTFIVPVIFWHPSGAALRHERIQNLCSTGCFPNVHQALKNSSVSLGAQTARGDALSCFSCWVTTEDCMPIGAAVGTQSGETSIATYDPTTFCRPPAS